MKAKMDGTQQKQDKVIQYYDKISGIYDCISNWYYKKARNYGIEELKIKKGQTVLNLPCGTGVNFKYFERHLENSGLIIGIDLSIGMLNQAQRKAEKNGWNNIDLELVNATRVDKKWLEEYSKKKGHDTVNAIFCDLGLSGLPEWRNIIDNMITILSPNGRIVILDWYLKEPSLRGKFVKWIGKGEVNRPIWHYLKSKVSDFKIVDSFNSGGVFIASGTKPNVSDY